jgi:hypothetical protein
MIRVFSILFDLIKLQRMNVVLLLLPLRSGILHLLRMKPLNVFRLDWTLAVALGRDGVGVHLALQGKAVDLVVSRSVSLLRDTFRPI